MRKEFFIFKLLPTVTCYEQWRFLFDYFSVKHEDSYNSKTLGLAISPPLIIAVVGHWVFCVLLGNSAVFLFKSTNRARSFAIFASALADVNCKCACVHI